MNEPQTVAQLPPLLSPKAVLDRGVPSAMTLTPEFASYWSN